MIDPSLAACATFIAPPTLAAVIVVESGGEPFAINVNRGPRLRPARNAQEAAQVARQWISRGYSVDLGLMQVNNRNLQRLGYTIEQMFDPCINVRAGATILAANYIAAAKRKGEGQSALLDALSAYNTGSYSRGYTNGYVGRYFNMTHSNIRVGAGRVVSTSGFSDPFSAETSVFSRKDNVNAGIGIVATAAQQLPGLE